MLKKTNKKALILAVCLLTVIFRWSALSIQAGDGKLHISKAEIRNPGFVKLEGNWAFYWEKLYDPAAFNQKNLVAGTFMKVPGTWTGKKVNNRVLPRTGYATYSLEIISDTAFTGLIYFQEIATSYKVWLNGKLISSAGTVSREEQTAIPDFKINRNIVNILSGNNLLIIQVSNYHHRVNSFEYAPVLGRHEKVDSIIIRNYAMDLIVIGFLLIMAFYHLGLYIFRPKSLPTLIFSIFCFLAILRVSVSDNATISILFPETNWHQIYFLNYFSFYTMAPTLVFLMWKIFRDYKYRWIYRMIYILSGIFVVTLFLPSLIYTQLVILFEGITFLYFLFLMIRLFDLYRFRREPGALIFLLSLVILATTAINDMLYFLDILPTMEMFSIGLFFMILGQALTLGLRFTALYTKNEELTERLYQQNLHLQDTVESRTKELEDEKHKLKETNKTLLKFYTAARQTHAILVITDLQGNIEYANPSFEKKTGYSLDEVLGKSTSILKSGKTERSVYDQLWHTIKQGKVWKGEFINKKKDGTEFIESAIISPIRDESGQVTNYVAIKNDISVLKAFEQELKERESKYRLLAENISDVIWTLDLKTLQYRYISPSIYKLRGITAEEALKETLEDSMTKKSFQHSMEMIKKIHQKIKEGITYLEGMFEIQLPCKDGRIIDCEVSYTVYCNEWGEYEILGLSRDITQRKLAEQALIKSEEKYRLLTENTSDIIWKLDVATRKYSYFSPSVYQLRGYTVEESLHQSLEEINSPETHKRTLDFLDHINQLKGKQELRIYNIGQITTRDRGYIDVEFSATILFDAEGNPTEILGVSRDVTQRMQAEKAMKDSEEKYRMITENTHDVIWKIDLATFAYNYVSPSVMVMRGYTVDEALEISVEESLTPESYQKVLEDYHLGIALAAENPHYGICNRYQQPCKDGRIIDVEVTASFIRDKQGIPVEIIGVTRDISEKVKIEQALAESEASLAKLLVKQTRKSEKLAGQLNSIFNNAFSAIAFLKVKNNRIKFLSCNGLWANSLGYNPEDLEGSDLENVCDAETYYLYQKYIFKAVDTQCPVYEYVYWHNMYLYTCTVPIYDEITTELKYCACFVYNVTDKFEAELKLHESENKFRSIFQSSKDAIILLDMTLHVVEFNDEIYNLLGEETNPTDNVLRQFIVPKYHSEIIKRFEKLKQGEKLPYFECEMIRHDGSIVPVELNSSVLIINKQEMVLSIVRDISFRKHYERNLVQAGIQIENRERRKLATDLHDNVGPLLSSMNMCLSLLARRPQVQELSGEIGDIRRILKESIASVREISNNISPQVLVKYGLISALELFFETKRKLIDVNFKTNLEEFRFGEVKETMIYNIIKEVFNNSLKYAQASLIELYITRYNNLIEVIYRDNGIGFDLQEKMDAASTSLGLFSIINRVKNLDGDYSMLTSQDNGFILKIIFPC